MTSIGCVMSHLLDRPFSDKQFSEVPPVECRVLQRPTARWRTVGGTASTGATVNKLWKLSQLHPAGVVRSVKALQPCGLTITRAYPVNIINSSKIPAYQMFLANSMQHICENVGGSVIEPPNLTPSLCKNPSAS